MKLESVQIYFSLENNKKYFLLFLVPFLLGGCIFEKNEVNQKSCIPKIVVEPSKDSLRIGEIFEVKVSLSDTTYLTVFDPIKEKKERFYPVFKVNNLMINNNYSDYFIVRDTVDNNVVYEEFPNYREINLSVIFPHPIEGEGTVELSKLVSYIVIKD